MAFEYPDVMNDITDARLRFESESVQYLAEFPPRSAPAGDIAQLTLILQNILDVPVNVGIHLDLPKPRGKLRRLPQPPFEVFESDFRLRLEDSEVGRLTIPIRVQAQVPTGEYTFTIHVQSAALQQGRRTRPDRRVDEIGDLKIRYPQGLGITQIVSWGFEAQKTDEQAVSLQVGEPTDEPASVDLKPQFTSLWAPQHWELIALARREVNDRRLHLIPELVPEGLYVPLMRESQATFADSDVRLHIGEAMFVAKILTYTATYLMSNLNWQDCLLVPIFAYAHANEQPTGDVLWLITELGYMHVLELAVALSFSLVEEALNEEMWDVTEQRASREFIVQCLGTETMLPTEFLYLPLILGGLAVARELVFDGEDIQHSLGLLADAKAERADLFADRELQGLNTAFERLIARQAQS